MHFYQYVLGSKQGSVKGSQLRQGRSLMGAEDLSHNTQLGISQLTDARRWQFIGGMDSCGNAPSEMTNEEYLKAQRRDSDQRE